MIDIGNIIKKDINIYNCMYNLKCLSFNDQIRLIGISCTETKIGNIK